jgi:hypothetical protein
MRLHPSKPALFEYAEGLAEGRIDADTARHVAACRRCAAEVDRVRQTLRDTGAADDLEPTGALTATILAAARAETRRETAPGRGLLGAVFVAGRAAAWAAVFVLAAGASFFVALEQAPVAPAAGSAAEPLARVTLSGPPPEALRRAASDLRVLASTLDAAPGASANPRERQLWRAARALRDDVAAAAAALEANPGNERASQVLNENLQRLMRTSRQLYAERSL